MVGNVFRDLDRHFHSMILTALQTRLSGRWPYVYYTVNTHTCHNRTEPQQRCGSGQSPAICPMSLWGWSIPPIPRKPVIVVGTMGIARAANFLVHSLAC